MKHILLRSLPFALVLLGSRSFAQTPALVLDISAGGSGSNTARIYAAGTNTVFFNANSGTGNDLWKSDGTAAGTVLVKDIPTSLSGPSSFTNAGGTLFFNASDDALYGEELWKTDGTDAGTFMVKDIVPGPTGANPRKRWDVNGTLVFQVDDGVNGEELWKSDGTATGTTLLKDINPGSDDAGLSNLRRDYCVSNGYLYFQASEPVNGDELWRTDGTTAGTTLVKDIRTGVDGSGPASMTDVNGVIFFSANDGAGNNGLWKSDGTATGTVFLASCYGAVELTNVNGTLFFTATHTILDFDYELWKSDGTSAGTGLVKDINPGTNASGPALLRNVNNTLFFRADDGVSGAELWKSDGTAAGTVLVKDINPGSGGIIALEMVAVNGVLFFDALEPVYGHELWRSDGTAAGTILTLDIYPGVQLSSPHDLTATANSLFFAATDDTHGVELWSVPNVSIGVEEIQNAGEFSLYPNPASDFVQLTLTGTAAGDVMIVDQLGAVVKRIRITRKAEMIEVHDLAPGIYIARVDRANDASSVRFVVQH